MAAPYPCPSPPPHSSSPSPPSLTTAGSASSANASSAGDDIANAANASDPMTLALHKSWGQKEMTVTRGQSVKKVEDDFVLYLDQLNGDNELAYTL